MVGRQAHLIPSRLHAGENPEVGATPTVTTGTGATASTTRGIRAKVETSPALPEEFFFGPTMEPRE